MKQVEKKNKAGQVKEIAFIDDDGQPVVHGMLGCAKIKRSFDANNRVIEERYYGVWGEPVIQKVHGFPKITWVYCGSRTVKLYHTHLRSKDVAIDSLKLEKLFRACRLSAIGLEGEA